MIEVRVAVQLLGIRSKMDRIVVSAVVCPGERLIVFGKKKTVAIEGHVKDVIWTGRKVNGFSEQGFVKDFDDLVFFFVSAARCFPAEVQVATN